MTDLHLCLLKRINFCSVNWSTGHQLVPKCAVQLCVLCTMRFLTCRYMTYSPSWLVFNNSGSIEFPVKPHNNFVVSVKIYCEL